MEKKTRKNSKAMEIVMKQFISMLGEAVPETEAKAPLCKKLKELIAAFDLNPFFRDLIENMLVSACEEDPEATKKDIIRVKEKIEEILEQLEGEKELMSSTVSIDMREKIEER